MRWYLYFTEFKGRNHKLESHQYWILALTLGGRKEKMFLCSQHFWYQMYVVSSLGNFPVLCGHQLDVLWFDSDTNSWELVNTLQRKG
jgi:hypothetical protein